MFDTNVALVLRKTKATFEVFDVMNLNAILGLLTDLHIFSNQQYLFDSLNLDCLHL